MLTCLLATNAMPAQNNVEMDRTDICKENYRTLFGGEALTGEGSDPEMMAILQKFIFGEVFTTGDLTLKQRGWSPRRPSPRPLYNAFRT